MCGIVGFFSLSQDGSSYGDAKVLRDLALADTVRGWDGTGLFQLQAEGKDKGTVWTMKVAGPTTNLMDGEQWPYMIDGARFAVVHNRASTIGGNTEDNAHPFMFEHVIGVHNGTLHNWDLMSLDKEFKEEHGISVDSHALYGMLNNADPDPESVATVLSHSYVDFGAYSLVWYDNRIDCLRFARNSQRPMNMVQTRHGLWVGSELRLLEWVLNRHRYDMIRSWETEPFFVIDIPTNGDAGSFLDYGDMRKPSYTSYNYGNAWDNSTGRISAWDAVTRAYRDATPDYEDAEYKNVPDVTGYGWGYHTGVSIEDEDDDVWSDEKIERRAGIGWVV